MHDRIRLKVTSEIMREKDLIWYSNTFASTTFGWSDANEISSKVNIKLSYVLQVSLMEAYQQAQRVSESCCSSRGCLSECFFLSFNKYYMPL